MNYGFKSYRKFQKRLYVWDVFERVAEQLVIDANEEGQPPTQHASQHMFINAVKRINANNTNIGKEEKAMQLFSLGLRCAIASLCPYMHACMHVSLYMHVGTHTCMHACCVV